MDSNRDSQARPPFPLPHHTEFTGLGVTLKQELSGGHQSRVVLATEHAGLESRDLVIKLIDTALVDRHDAMERIRVRDRVAAHDDRVVPLVPLAGAKANRVGSCLAIASVKVLGRHLDVTDRSDVERMGRALARLHESLRLVHAELPPVSALRAGEPVEGLLDNHQLLHGDFGAANLLLDADGRLWILDFDECGFGPVEFELGNTLFMTLFATSSSLNQPSDDYRRFRHFFLGAYRASSEHPISELLVDLALQARSDALRYWLNHLDDAPAGIRFASADWHRHLRAFAGVMI